MRSLFFKSIKYYLIKIANPISIMSTDGLTHIASQRNGSKNSNNLQSVDCDQAIEATVDKPSHTYVKEGKAEIIFPSSLDVFYNPVQEFNRDMSVAVLRVFASDFNRILALQSDNNTLNSIKPVKQVTEEDFEALQNINEACIVDTLKCGVQILEALAASGLRSIRYALEVGGIRKIVANDFSSSAVDCQKHNIKHNNVDGLVKASLCDASMYMYQNRNIKDRFHAIDIDPYGSPHTFLDGAVQSIADGGLLLITSTDMAVLCGNCPETCHIKYGALSLRHKACHEMALRIVLQCVESHANRYGKYIKPLLSLSADFYTRVFVQIFSSAKKCKESFTKLAWVHHCPLCDSTLFQPLGNIAVNGNSVKYHLTSPPSNNTCEHCSHKLHTGGPIWLPPIHDKSFVSRVKSSLVEDLATHRRIFGTLTLVEEELPDVPLYITLDKVAKVLRMSTLPQAEFSSALLNAGYRVSSTHARKNSLKTDAPFSVIWDIMRSAHKRNPTKLSRLPNDHPAHVILSKQPSMEVDFSPHPEAKPHSFVSKDVLRFQHNPEKNWGPKARAKTSVFHSSVQEKKERHQGKRKTKSIEEKDKKPKIT